MAKIRITLIKSTIRRPPRQRATVRTLGLRKIGSHNEMEDNPAVRGMIRAVSHLVSVEDVK